MWNEHGRGRRPRREPKKKISRRGQVFSLVLPGGGLSGRAAAYWADRLQPAAMSGRFHGSYPAVGCRLEDGSVAAQSRVV